MELVRRLRPAIVLMDVGLPDGSGVAATKRIVAEQPEVRVVVVTTFDDGLVGAAAIRGAQPAMCVKDAGHAEIVAAVRAAVRWCRNVALPPPGQSAVTFAEPVEDPFRSSQLAETPVPDLVVRRVVNGQIADQPGLLGKTVRNMFRPSSWWSPTESRPPLARRELSPAPLDLAMP